MPFLNNEEFKEVLDVRDAEVIYEGAKFKVTYYPNDEIYVVEDTIAHITVPVISFMIKREGREGIVNYLKEELED